MFVLYMFVHIKIKKFIKKYIKKPCLLTVIIDTLFFSFFSTFNSTFFIALNVMMYLTVDLSKCEINRWQQQLLLFCYSLMKSDYLSQSAFSMRDRLQHVR